MAKSKQENMEVARVCVCVCGQNPVTVKSGKRYMLACPDSMRCTIRGCWATNEQTAIKNWNATVQYARNPTSE